VPANAVCLFNNLCQKCRDNLGWTDEKLEAHWAKFKAEERTPCPTCEGKGFINGSCCRKCEGSMSLTINKEGFEKP
jgi:DnaJ-class molecular chaperone